MTSPMRIDKESHAERQTEKNILESARFNLVECTHRNAYRNQSPVTAYRSPERTGNGKVLPDSRMRLLIQYRRRERSVGSKSRRL